MHCPYSFEMLESIRGAGMFRIMEDLDYMGFAGAAPGSVLMTVGEEWIILYGNSTDDDPGTEPYYEACWNDSEWEERGGMPIDSTCWIIKRDQVIQI